MAVVDCNNWSSGTLYICVVSMRVVLVGRVWPDSYSFGYISSMSCFYLVSHILVYPTSAVNSSSTMIEAMLWSPKIMS